ncbi:MAG: dihydroorotate dehydrogenase electron transfer subunit [Clostridia bacterium]|nr:dihydroorotate dehydrogenase electron transfer subunit [Clostridia bacterium]MDH7572149.1 dihydroorotate dehydrogenase electron transfer subunit [Clostridia bacterium]
MTGPTRATVVDQEDLGAGGRHLILESPEIAANAQPGQFVHLRVGEGYDPLLPRPFSLHEADRRAGRIGLLYRVKGRGTAWLAGRRPGDRLEILGPLGKGFPLPQGGVSALLVGGGTGVAPLFFLARELSRRGHRLRFLMGAATAAELWRLSALRELVPDLAVTTEDGSLGIRGRVTDLLPGHIGGQLLQVYAAGPNLMLRAVAEWSRRVGAPAWVSLEQIMACGVGLCRGCVVPVAEGYARVCTEGPVMPAERVVWDGTRPEHQPGTP